MCIAVAAFPETLGKYKHRFVSVPSHWLQVSTDMSRLVLCVSAVVCLWSASVLSLSGGCVRMDAMTGPTV